MNFEISNPRLSMNPDELEPVRPVLKPVDLQQMSVADLEDYITVLETEIKRVENMIAKKKAHKSGVEALFGGKRE